MDGPERDACYEINQEFMARMKAEAEGALEMKK